MGKSSAPPAPDYTAAAQQTAAGNLQNLQYQTAANRPNVVTPWGNETWTQGTDASGKPNNNWTQTVNLTPETQAALNAQQTVQNNQSQLAQTMQGQVASTMAHGYTAPDMGAYVNGVPSVNSNFGAFSSTAPGQNTNFSSSAQNVNTNAAGAVAGAGSVNLNAPQFSDAMAQQGAQAAYNAGHSLIADQQHQDSTNLDSQLRLQGLQPGTEAYNNAMQNLQRTQDQQNNNLASQSVLTGNQMANANYASQLAGFGANQGAQQQAYNEGANTFTLGNAALGQQYGQGANTFSLNNNAANTAFDQGLAGYSANQAARQNSNAAQQQAYAQAMQKYQTAYANSYQQYLQPLNSMNAVMTGNQVAMPSFPGFSQSGVAEGPNYSQAAQLTGQYNSAANAASNANASGTAGVVGGLASAAIIAF